MQEMQSGQRLEQHIFRTIWAGEKRILRGLHSLMFPHIFSTILGSWIFVFRLGIEVCLLITIVPLLFFFLLVGLSYLLVRPRIRRVHHVVTPEGITFYHLSLHIYSPWENIAGIGVMLFGIYRVPALLLRQPAEPGSVPEGHHLSKATLQPGRLNTKKSLVKRGYGNAIPLFLTVPDDWQNSELGAYIMLYAPQVQYTHIAPPVPRKKIRRFFSCGDVKHFDPFEDTALCYTTHQI